MKQKLRVWTAVLSALVFGVLALLLWNRPDRHGVRIELLDTNSNTILATHTIFVLLKPKSTDLAFEVRPT